MRIIELKKYVFTALSITCVMLFSASTKMAQDKMKPLYFQAQAMGQAQDLGRNQNVTLIIEEFSTPADQKALLEAFQQKGNEGVVNALSKMHAKGRLAITGTLGYDVNYIRKFTMPDGNIMYRVVTDRAIKFGEVYADTRSSEYELSGMELIITKNKKDHSGTLFPAAKFIMDKENHIKIELYRNAWKLVAIQQR